MKIEALSSFGLRGEVVQIGEVVEASPAETRQLINSGQAKEAVICEVQKEPKPKAKKTPKAKPTPTQEVTEE